METTASNKKGLPLFAKVFIGLILGAICGAIGQVLTANDPEAAKQFTEFVKTWIQPIGKIFLNMIFMIVVPLLFSALVLGVAEIGNPKKVGRVGLYSLLMTVILSGIAVAIGVLLVNTLKPGSHVTPEERTRIVQQYSKPDDAAKKIEDSKKAKVGADFVTEIVPDNPLNSAVNALQGGILPFMFFALIFGLALTMVEAEKALPVVSFLEGIFAISLKVIDIAMKLAPIGVFALIFGAASAVGVGAIKALGSYALLVLFALAFHQFVVYSLAIALIAKRKPLEFFRQIRTVMLTAFSTSSSNATLPAALQAAENEVGLPRDISSFVLTVGATANQNGTALFEGITIIFLAQFFGISLDLGQQFTVMGLAIVAGIGTAGVPGGSWPVIAIIMTKVGIPPEGIGICLGIDRILDMSRTVLNVTGDITIAACVTRLMGRNDSELAMTEA